MTASLRMALLACAFVAGAVESRAQVITPPQRADKVNITITASVTFSSSTGLYTYSYSLKSGNGSQQNVWMFAVASSSSSIVQPISPVGWTFDPGAETGFVSWAATEPPASVPANQDQSVLLESPYTIKKGKTLAGFSFKSPHPAASVTAYVQGWTPRPLAVSDLDYADAGYDMNTFDLTQNSAAKTTQGPRSPCADGADND